jgi:hypothetical protein
MLFEKTQVLTVFFAKSTGPPWTNRTREDVGVSDVKVGAFDVTIPYIKIFCAIRSVHRVMQCVHGVMQILRTGLHVDFFLISEDMRRVEQ